MIIKNQNFLIADTPIEDIKELIYERHETSEIKNRVVGFFTGTEPAFFRLISGPSGCGKTLSVLSVLFNFIKEHPQFSKDFVYINGNMVRTPKAMYRYMAQQLGVNTTDNTISSFVENIELKLNEAQRGKLIIIDEVDKIYKNSRESPKYLFIHSLACLARLRPG